MEEIKPLVQTSNTGRRVSIIKQYNMQEDVKRWRMMGLSYRQTTEEIKKKFGVTLSLNSLYNFCVRNGLDGDMSGEREKTVNVYQDLLDSLKTVEKSIATNEAILEEVQQTIGTTEFDSKLYIAAQTSLDKMLNRRTALLQSIVSSQALIFKYKTVSDFMGRVQTIVIEKAGLAMWNEITAAIADDVILNELLKEIPKDEKEVKPRKNRPNEGKSKRKMGVEI